MKAHGIECNASWEIYKGALIIGGGCDNSPMPQNSKIIIQDTKRPEHDVIEVPFRSYLRNFVCEIVSYGFGGVLQPKYWDATVAAKNISVNAVSRNASTNYTGCQVGSGNTAVAATDYKLQTLILSGTDSGKLSKSAGTTTNPSIVGDVLTTTRARTFTNNTVDNADVTVREIGILVDNNSDDQSNMLFARDVVADVVIPYLGSKTITTALTLTRTDDKSFTRNMGMVLKAILGGTAGGEVYYNLAGAAQTLTNDYILIGDYGALYGGTPTLRGISVGTSDQVVSMNDNDCIIKIANGTGAGQLSYGAMTLDTNVTVSGSDSYVIISRLFTNSSSGGGDITVKEYCLNAEHASFTSCIFRGRINSGTGITLANGDSLNLKVKIQVSV